MTHPICTYCGGNATECGHGRRLKQGAYEWRRNQWRGANNLPKPFLKGQHGHPEGQAIHTPEIPFEAEGPIPGTEE